MSAGLSDNLGYGVSVGKTTIVGVATSGAGVGVAVGEGTAVATAARAGGGSGSLMARAKTLSLSTWALATDDAKSTDVSNTSHPSSSW